MARAQGRSKIWVRPIASMLACKQLSKEEEADVCIDDEENVKTESNNRVQNIMDSVKEKAKKVSQHFEHDVGLQEEYKQLLVKAVAERIKRKMSENEMWTEIEKETGFNHKVVWNAMREAIIKKISRLLPANDLLKDIPTQMQLSPSDWLLFDLILVHEQIDVINIESLSKPPYQWNSQGKAMSKKEEPQCLQELFELVKHYDIENLVGEHLISAWTYLTTQYNSRGRQCSAMMLQLRWYQLKKYTRSRFYEIHAHNNNQDIQNPLEANVSINLTVLQLEIAVVYNNLITQEYPSWETLINEKRVILAQEFTTKSQQVENKTPNSTTANQSEPLNESPILLIKLNENQVEDFHLIKNAKGNTCNDDKIVIDLKNDQEYLTALQKVMANSKGSTKLIDNNDGIDENEFKIRVIRALLKQGFPEKKFSKFHWEMFNRAMGCDCKGMLDRMRNAIPAKLITLLAASDISQNVWSIKRLSESEWLYFDYILVHENICSVSIEFLELKCLRELVNLVLECGVENLSGEELVEAWLSLTLKYNRGIRQCSPMLIQLRWYQLKELTRKHVNKEIRILDKHKTKILFDIATKFQKIVTHPFVKWYTLVKQKMVILPEEFIRILKEKGKRKDVKPHEWWYLHIKEISNSEQASITKILKETDNNPLSHVTLSKSNEIEEPEIIELDSDDEINEILREKADKISNISQEKVKNIMNISQTQLKSDGTKNQPDVDQVVPKPVTVSISNDEPILCDSDDEMDKLLQEKANLMSIELPETLKDLDTIIGEEVDEFKKVKKDQGKHDHQNDALDEADFDDNNIEFVDDGIQFEEGNDCEITETTSTKDLSSDNEDKSDAEECNDEPQIDQKLLMDTKVSTTKLDVMEVFKFIEYESIRDKRLIEHVETESKPVSKTVPKTVDNKSRMEANNGFDSDCVESSHDEAETSFQEEQKIKYTSWLLQKPRKRKYTSRQLTKNPDFNNQLKKLTSEFLSSTRNKELLEECQPLTVDLHKTFEKKLVNGKLYLQPSNFKSHYIRENHRTPDILTEEKIKNMKLAEHVRDLIATMTADGQDDDVSITGITEVLPSRSKDINLPDKNQICLIDQNLLTAEISSRHRLLLNTPADNAVNSEDNDIAIICTEESPNKRLKTDQSSGSDTTNEYCCWAREKISSTDEILDHTHMCIKSCCTCCCRADLAAHLSSKNNPLQSPNTLSNISYPSKIDTHSNRVNNVNTEVHTSSVEVLDTTDTIVTISSPNTTTYGKKTFMVNIKSAHIGIPSKEIRKDDSKVATTSKMPSPKILNYTIDYKNYVNRTAVCEKPTDRPLSVVKASTNELSRNERETGAIKTMPPYIKIAPNPPKNSPRKQNIPTYVLLPPGVNFVQLEDKQVALAINPGVQLEPEELQSLMSVCAVMNASPKTQIKKVPSVPMSLLSTNR